MYRSTENYQVRRFFINGCVSRTDLLFTSGGVEPCDSALAAEASGQRDSVDLLQRQGRIAGEMITERPRQPAEKWGHSGQAPFFGGR